MTPKNPILEELEKTSKEINDEGIIKYALQPLSVPVLVKIAKAEVDMHQLAKKELTQRGLDLNGEWIGRQ